MNSVVVSIDRRRQRELVKMYRHFLELAGLREMRGSAVCALRTDGGEEIAVAGSYRRFPDQAVAAAMRLSWRITQREDNA